MPTILCPRCKTKNRPAGLSALHCTNCHRSIDPRELGDTPGAFVKRQRKLRRKSEALTQDEADELLEWVMDLPPGGPAIEDAPGPLRSRLKTLIGLIARPWHWVTATGRGPRTVWLYADGVVRMGEDRLVINRYYWPFGRKRIEYSEIRDFTSRPLKAWHGQYRVHGIDHLGRWYSRDRHRGEKELAIDLTVGRLFHPVLTPDDVDTVLAILERQTNLPN